MKTQTQEKSYSQRFFNVLQTQKDGTILRKFEKLNTYEAESVFFKIANSYPVRYGAQNVKMIEINPNTIKPQKPQK